MIGNHRSASSIFSNRLNIRWVFQDQYFLSRRFGSRLKWIICLQYFFYKKIDYEAGLLTRVFLEEVNDKDLRVFRCRFTRILNPEHNLSNLFLCLFCSIKFTMNKSKLNLGANVGDIPHGMTRPEIWPGRTWRFTWDPVYTWRFNGDPPWPDGLHETCLNIMTHWWSGVRDQRMTRPKAQKAGSRLTVGRFKRKGIRNICLIRS